MALVQDDGQFAPGGVALKHSHRNTVTLTFTAIRPSVTAIWSMHAVWLYFGLVWCILSGELHDYWSYVEQWKLVLAGANPWGPLLPQYGVNTYGPVHNLLASFLNIHVLAPKVFIFAVFAVASTMLLRRILRERPDDWLALMLYVLAVPGNMLITLFAFAFGTNDLLIAAFLIFAILAKLDGKIYQAAFWMTLGILLKFYPALFIPLFMVERRRIDLRFGVAVAAFCIIGMAGSYLAWGSDILTPFGIAAVRSASFLSPFIPMMKLDEAITGGAIVGPMILYNGILVILVAVLLSLLCWWRNHAWMAAMVIVILACFLTYKVGHQQFFMGWSCAVASLVLLRRRDADRIALAALPYLFFLSGFSYLHVLEDQYTFAHVGRWPYIAFPAALLSLVLMLRVKVDPTPVGGKTTA